MDHCCMDETVVACAPCGGGGDVEGAGEMVEQVRDQNKEGVGV